MGRDGTRIAAYSAAHFAVDFVCAYLLYAAARGQGQWYLCLLAYNFCAFALQMPLGLVADKVDRNAVFAAAGCLFVASAGFFSAAPVALSVVAGIGNAMFHVGGGVDALNLSGEKAGLLGVFVSPGAFGIYFGAMLGKSHAFAIWPSALAMLAFCALLLLVCRRPGYGLRSGNAPLSLEGAASGPALAALLCLFAVVCLRSWVGMAADFPWKSGGLGFALVCAAALGKAAGGFVSDRVGISVAAPVSLACAAALFVLSGYPAAGVAAMFLFNMTMPITLWAVAKLLPGAKGFSFGMLTFGLFIGFLPVYLGWGAPLPLEASLALGAALSIPPLLFGLGRAARQ